MLPKVKFSIRAAIWSTNSFRSCCKENWTFCDKLVTPLLRLSSAYALDDTACNPLHNQKSYKWITNQVFQLLRWDQREMISELQAWVQVQELKYKYKYKYRTIFSFKYKYKYKYRAKFMCKYKYKYKYRAKSLFKYGYKYGYAWCVLVWENYRQ